MNENTETSNRVPVADLALTPEKPPSPELALGAGFGVWVPVSERLPRAGQRVIVTALNGIHIWRTLAEYWPAGKMDASDWEDPPEAWWDDGACECSCQGVNHGLGALLQLN